MKSVDYKVDRNRIYLGKVGRIYDFTEYYVNNKNDKRYYTDGYYPYRFMVFVMSDDGHANDLMYESRNYPVLGYADNQEFTKQEQTKAVVKCECLGDLLAANGYPEQLGYADIMKILIDFCYCNYLNREPQTECGWAVGDTLYREHYLGVYEEHNINLATFTPDSLRRDVKRRFKRVKCDHIIDVDTSVETKELKNLLAEVYNIYKKKRRGPFKPFYSEEGLIKVLRRF